MGGPKTPGQSSDAARKEAQYRSRVQETKLSLIEEQRASLAASGPAHREEISQYLAALYVARLELFNLRDQKARQGAAQRVSLLEIKARETQDAGRTDRLNELRLAEESEALRSGKSEKMRSRGTLPDPYLASAQSRGSAVSNASTKADSGTTFSRDTVGLRPFLARFVPLSVLVDNKTDASKTKNSSSTRNLLGIQIEVRGSSLLMAPASGHVIHAKDFSGFRNLLVIEHSDDLVSVFGNLDELLVKQGESVAAGQPVARLYESKDGAAKQFYYEVRDKGQAIALAASVEEPSRLAAALLTKDGNGEIKRK